MKLQTTIHCTQSLRQLWPAPLASWWQQQYPNIFDDDDLRITPDQPSYHFCEWFAAIHLFQRDGAHSLVEKYLFKNHPRKVSQLLASLGQERIDVLSRVCEGLHVQSPDLFVHVPNTSRYWFAEVKGPNDSLSAGQVKSHELITRELGIPVETIVVRIEE